MTDPKDVVLHDLVLPAPVPARGPGNAVPVGARLDLMELEARFNWAIDSRDYGALHDLFTEDAVIDHQWGYREGRQAVVDLIEEHHPDEDESRHQHTNHAFVAREDGSVTVLSYLNNVRVDGGPGGEPVPFLQAHGLFVTENVEVGGVWKIRRLTLDQTSVSTAVVGDRASWGYMAATAPERAEIDGRTP